MDAPSAEIAGSAEEGNDGIAPRTEAAVQPAGLGSCTGGEEPVADADGSGLQGRKQPETPDAAEGAGEQPSRAPAANAVKLFTAPCAADAQGTHGGDNHRSLRTDVAGQLNPTWVEWLMGFPPGWTELNASETL